MKKIKMGEMKKNKNRRDEKIIKRER